MATADQLGAITWWGFTPALDLQDTGNHNHGAPDLERHPPPFFLFFILSIF